MSNRTRIMAGLLASVSGMLSGMPASAEPLPIPVVAAVKENKDQCKPDKATLKDGFLTRKDVNGDGIVDYVLDYGSFQCGDNSTYLCGSAGCLTQVFASADGGFVKVLDENVQQVSFKKVKGRSAMLLGLHGSACDKVGAAPCGAVLYWNGSKFSAAH